MKTKMEKETKNEREQLNELLNRYSDLSENEQYLIDEGEGEIEYSLLESWECHGHSELVHECIYMTKYIDRLRKLVKKMINKNEEKILKLDTTEKVKQLEEELEYSNKRFQYLQYVWFDLYVNKTHTSLTNRLVYSVKECVFCSKEIKDWGNNSQPIQKGRCCDDCNKKLVIPFRIQELKKHKKDIDEKE